jgi:hypothetical protein
VEGEFALRTRIIHEMTILQYYIVWIAWDVVECTMIWFFAVETKGRTL